MSLFKSEKVNDRITKIYCPGNVCAFLVIGTEKATLIDSGFGIGSLKSYIEEITNLPIVSIATHGHCDHIGGAEEFDTTYIHQKDLQLAVEWGKIEVRRAWLGADANTYDTKDFVAPAKEDKYSLYESEQEFDLGGIHIKLLPMPGHTQGSHAVLFVEDRIVLFGDACNSALFLQVEGCSTIEQYQKDLQVFYNNYFDLFDTVLYSHPHNFGDKNILPEMIKLCGQILEPDFKGAEMPEILGPGIMIAKPINEYFGPTDGTQANIVYCAESLKRTKKISDMALQVRAMLQQAKDQAKTMEIPDEQYAQMLPAVRKGNDDTMASMIAVPENIEIKEKTVKGHWCEYYSLKNKDKNTDIILMYIHGGGFENGSVKSRRFAPLTIIQKLNADCIAPEYTQWPEENHPQGLMDCIDVFDGLVEMGYKPENIYIAGESGGATLLLQMTLYFKAQNHPLPGKLAALCPATDIEDSFASHTERDEIDPEVTANPGKLMMKHYFKDCDPKDPLVSVQYGDFHDFPPTFIGVGTDEVLYDDSIDLHNKLDVCHVKNKLVVYENMYHAFQLFPLEESVNSLNEVGEFLKNE